MASSEVPNLLDLHLFLGLALTLTGPLRGPRVQWVGVDGVLGLVPQSMVDDDEDCSLRTTQEE